MTFVLDASVTMTWFFDGERTVESEAVMGRTAAEGALVPSLWKLEVASAFRAATRR